MKALESNHSQLEGVRVVVGSHFVTYDPSTDTTLDYCANRNFSTFRLSATFNETELRKARGYVSKANIAKFCLYKNERN